MYCDAQDAEAAYASRAEEAGNAIETAARKAKAVAAQVARQMQAACQESATAQAASATTAMEAAAADHDQRLASLCNEAAAGTAALVRDLCTCAAHAQHPLFCLHT